MLESFTQLDAWKKAMDLAETMYRTTQEFPREEIYGMTSQIRRAASSVPANIAEGFGRQTSADKMHKYVQARGELTELMSHIHYCQRVKLLTEVKQIALLGDCETVHKLLNGLIRRMNTPYPQPQPKP